MEKTSLKFKTFSGLIWRFSERILAQLVTTLVTIILARILTPEDYGTIAIITVFIQICNIFASASFGNALIQKKDADNIDFSSVFYISMGLATVLYTGLFFLAPFVAEFYEIPILCPLLRVMGLNIPFTALKSIQLAHISSNFAFKNSFFSAISGTCMSAVVGIYMAYEGYGVWALCAQYLINNVISAAVLGIMIKWRPALVFSFKRAKSLFSYGWKLLASKLLEELNVELKSFFIGKVYSPADLAYYNRGKQFPTLINTNINESISTVLFPAMSAQQDNKELLQNYMKRSIKISTFVIFPLQLGLMVIAKPLTVLLLTEKWLPSVPFLQIMSICYCLTPIYTVNAQVLKAMGKSQYYLLSSIFTNICGILIMLVFLNFGVIYVALGGLISTLVMTIAFSRHSRRDLKYGLWAQLSDLLPNIINSAVMVIAACFAGMFITDTILKLFVEIFTGVVVYIVTAKIIKNDSFDYVLELIKSMIKRKA